MHLHAPGYLSLFRLAIFSDPAGLSIRPSICPRQKRSFNFAEAIGDIDPFLGHDHYSILADKQNPSNDLAEEAPPFTSSSNIDIARVWPLASASMLLDLSVSTVHGKLFPLFSSCRQSVPCQRINTVLLNTVPRHMEGPGRNRAKARLSCVNSACCSILKH